MSITIENIEDTSFEYKNNFYEFQYVRNLDYLNPITIKYNSNGPFAESNYENKIYLFINGISTEIISNNIHTFRDSIFSLYSERILKYNVKLIQELQDAYKETFPEEFI